MGEIEAFAYVIKQLNKGRWTYFGWWHRWSHKNVSRLSTDEQLVAYRNRYITDMQMSSKCKSSGNIGHFWNKNYLYHLLPRRLFLCNWTRSA